MKKAPVVFLIAFIIFFAGILYLSEVYPYLSVNKDETLRIGMILYGAHDGRGLSESHYDAVLAVAREKGLVLEFFENVSDTDECRLRLNELIDDGCGLIILDSGRFAPYSREAAISHPDIYFLNAYGTSYRDNLAIYSCRMYQASYLSGIIAGLQTENNRIGYVAGYPAAYFISDIDAFALGARKYNKDAEIYVRFGGFDNDIEAAELLIKEHDVDVLECNCYSDRSLKKAEEAGIWSIGCQRNNYNLFSWGYLTSEVCDWRGFYETQTENVLNGTFRGNSYLLGMDTGTVELSSLTKNVKKGISKKVEEAEEMLISNRGDVFYGPIYDSEGELRVRESESMPDRDIFNNIDWYVPGVHVDGL